MRRYLQRHGHDEAGRITVRLWRGEWWRYFEGRYIRVDAATIHNDLTAAIKWIFDHEPVTDQWHRVLRVNRGTITNTLSALASHVEVPEDLESPAWIGEGDDRQFFSMTNALVDREGLLEGRVVLEGHTPEWFSRVQFPYPFEEGATCAGWVAFLEQMLEGDQDRIALLQEFFGYCLIHDTRQHKFLVLEGEGANGKSVALEVLTQLVGPDNVSNVPLEAFNGRFQLTSTIGKLVNIATEVGDMDRPSEAILKQFTAGDRMHFDRKHVAPIEAYPTARLVLAANNRPRFSDGSGGLWRRMLIIPFRVVIPLERQDHDLGSKLAAELPGIFNWAVQGLRRLQEQGRFTVPRVSQEALDDYRLESNPARVFLTDYCREEVGAITLSSNLYSSYVMWCGSNGYPPENASVFGKEVFRTFRNLKKTRLGTRAGRVHAYDGLAQHPTCPVISHFSQIGGTEIEEK